MTYRVVGGAKGAGRVHPPAYRAVSDEQTRAPRSLAERQVKRTRRVRTAELAPGVELSDLLASPRPADPRWARLRQKADTSQDGDAGIPGPHVGVRSWAPASRLLETMGACEGRHESSFHIHRYANEHVWVRRESTRGNGTLEASAASGLARTA